MKFSFRITTLLLLGTLLSAGWAEGDKSGAAPLIPMKDFFKNPAQAGYQLSPNGEYLSFLQPWENRLNVFVQKIGDKEAIQITQSTERDIRSYFWANNERLVYLQDKGGDENFHLYGVDKDGQNLRDLTPFDSVTVQIIDDLEDIEAEMIIGLNKRDKRIFDAYRLNINTGDLNLVGENPGNISDWMTDNNGKIRVATTTDGVNTSLLYRASEDQPFATVLTTSFRETMAPLFFSFDNKYVFAASNLNGRDKTAIVKYDIANAKELDVLFEHKAVDVTDLMRSKKRKKLTGVAFTTDKRSYHFFDKERATLQKKLEQKLPGYEVVITDMDRQERKMMIRTYSDKSRGAYYYYNADTGELRKLVEVTPWIDENQMADQKPISYQSRDGLTIHGYLTLPKGVEAKNLPVVVNPHGGPWYRDAWGFNPEVQFLANRGYAVLQINFRGSTGYGREFWEASFKEWGKKMQDDITDGVKWLIKEGIADPERVGIYGGSYGGYATLAGLTFTPDLYACGVDYVGVSNIFTWINAFPDYWKPYLEMVYEMVGHPEKDKELLESASPIFHVDKIKAALLVAQGANDPRVKKEESDQMVDALRARGIDVPYIVKDNEGHGFHNE
ncbi:MAG: S9 family peptidase, partial [Calditrichaeota bacterium]|nr:S9 family peptidase [Calditrichota bacterium]